MPATSIKPWHVMSQTGWCGTVDVAALLAERTPEGQLVSWRVPGAEFPAGALTRLPRLGFVGWLQRALGLPGPTWAERSFETEIQLWASSAAPGVQGRGAGLVLGCSGCSRCLSFSGDPELGASALARGTRVGLLRCERARSRLCATAALAPVPAPGAAPPGHTPREPGLPWQGPAGGGQAWGGRAGVLGPQRGGRDGSACSSFLGVFFAVLHRFLLLLLVAAEASWVSVPGLLQYVYLLIFSASGQVLFSLFLCSHRLFVCVFQVLEFFRHFLSI